MKPDPVAEYIAKYGDPDDPLSKFYRKREGRGFVDRLTGIGKQIGAGLGEPVATDVVGLANLLGVERFAGQDIGDANALLEQRRRESAPQTTGERVARGVSRVAGEIGQFSIPGSAAAKATKGMGFLARAGANVAASAPISVAQSQVGPQESTAGALGLESVAESPFKRGLFEVGVDVVGTGALEGLARGLRGVRGGTPSAPSPTEAASAARQADELRPVVEATGTPRATREVLQKALREADDSVRQFRMAELTDEQVDAVLNVPKWAGDDPHAAAEIRNAVRRVAGEFGPIDQLKGRRSGASLEAAAKDLELDVQEVLEKAPADLTDAEVLMLRNVGNSVAGRAGEIARKLADSTLPLAERETLQVENERLHQLLARTVMKGMLGGTERGRGLQSMKYVGRKNNEPAVWLVEAQRALGTVSMDTETRERIIRLALEARADPSKQGAILNEIAGLQKSTPLEKVVTFWKSNLLWLSQIPNVIGNTTMAVLESAKDPAASFADMAISAFFRTERTKASMGNLGALVRGAKLGLGDAARALRGDISPEAIEKLDIPRRVNFDHALLNTYTNLPFRFLESGDRVFMRANLERSLAEQARLVARRAGWKGKEAEARVLDMLQNPPDELALEAIGHAELAGARRIAEQDALVATFRNRGRAAAAAGEIKSGFNKLTFGGGEFIAPFTTTPANIGARTTEMSPLGFIAGVGELAYRATIRNALKGSSGMTPEVQRRIADTLGRSATASAPIVAGILLAREGLLTGGLTSDQQERDTQLGLLNEQPRSILINGKWRSLERISPLGNLLILGADMYQAWNDPERGLLRTPATIAFSSAETLTQQPFLTGTQQFLGALTDRELREAGKFTDTLAGSVVPTPIRALARGLDPTMRQTEGPLDAIIAGIPLASKTLPEKLNQFGQPRDRGRGVLGQLFDPLASTPDRRRDDALIAEIDRVGANIGFRRQQKKAGETIDAFNEFVRREGPIIRDGLEALVNSPEYQALTLEEQAQQIEAMSERIRRRTGAGRAVDQ